MKSKSVSKKKFKNNLQFDLKVYEGFNILDRRDKATVQEVEELIDKFVGINKKGVFKDGKRKED